MTRIVPGTLHLGGEYSEAADFFDPLHHAHMAERCPVALPFLALPPG